MNSGIYKITSPTGKIYIGQSVNIKKRFGMYRRYDCVGQTKLYRSLKKYGHEKHKFEIIHYSKDNLNDLEIYYIELFQSIGINGLNLRTGGSNSKYSDESKLKMRNAKLGKKRPPHSEETKRKIKETCLKRDFSIVRKILVERNIENGRINKFKKTIKMKSKKITAEPMFNYCFLTCNKKSNVSKSGIITNAKDIIDMKQDILKVGDSVRTLKPGYTVEIDPRPYFVKDWEKQNSPTLNEELHKKIVSIAWPIEEIDGIDVMVVPDNHIRMYWKNGLE